MPEPNPEPHEPTEVCRDWHCYTHNTDEPVDRPYRICPECFHAYPTARALRRTYRRNVMAVYAEWWPRIRVALTPARTIRFCPECAHDF